MPSRLRTERARAYAPRAPLLPAAAAQCGALLPLFVLAALLPDWAPGARDPFAWAWLQGLGAAALGRALRMDAWWLPINALFVPGLVWMLGLGLPPAYALGAFCLLAAVFWGACSGRVPLFLSSQSAARALADLLPQGRSFSFLDLGCGLGGLLSSAARARPAGRFFGIEAAPLPFLFARLRTALAARSCEVSWGDYNSLDLGRYDVVYAYLSPAAMTGLWQKARREMRSGSVLISNSFAIPGVAPAHTVATGAGECARLLLWRM